MRRNISVIRRFMEVADSHVPEYRFAGSSQADWQTWTDALLPKVKATLGRMPAKVALEPQVLAQWCEDGLIKQKVIFNVEQGLAVTAWVFRPENVKGKVPGILACHGHGTTGKDAVMGHRGTPEHVAQIALYNYDYGLQMAKAGYAVIAIDWRGFGERDDRRKPNTGGNIGGRDICNVHFLRATVLGMTLLGLDVHDGMCAIDYLSQQDYVDADNIGVMGLSFGGAMTTWMSICDDRIKAADIMCYSDRFADFGIRDTNFCGSQITPGLFALCDLPDLQGLIAPRPLLVEFGVFDDCFKIESATSCFNEVAKIYEAAEVREQLELDQFEGGHAFGGNKAVGFFDRHLKGVR